MQLPKMSLKINLNPPVEEKPPVIQDNALKDFEEKFKIPYENIKKGDKIGQGSQASVFKAEIRSLKKIVALKEIYIQNDHELKNLKNELLILQGCQHPNLVSFHGFNINENKIQVAIEYLDFGKLNYLLQLEGALPEPIVSVIALQILRGLDYLHSDRKIIHRDLKPSNVLLNTMGDVKISDFGISRQVIGTEGNANTFIGTKLYMSPERLKGGDYRKNADLWSVGLIVFECALGKFPCIEKIRELGLIEDEYCEFMMKGGLLDFPKNFSEELKDFIKQCLKPDPSQRGTAKVLLEHPFIKKGEKIPKEIFKKWLDCVIQKKIPR
jgi:serine/threonine protein kinase